MPNVVVDREISEFQVKLNRLTSSESFILPLEPKFFAAKLDVIAFHSNT